MKRPLFSESWPQSWKESYHYDREEIWNEPQVYGYAYAYANRRRETLRLLTDVLAPGARVLDLAAAQGNFSLALAELGYDVTWNDLRAELADYVRLKHERGALQFAPGNAFELQFPQPFDAVLAAEVIEHVAHPDEFLRQVMRLVRPGGYIVLSTPNGAYFDNTLPKFSECNDPTIYETAQFKPNADGHIFLLHPEEIASLAAAAGMQLDQLAIFTNPLTAGFLKSEAALRVVPKAWIDLAETATRSLPHYVRRKMLVHLAARLRK